MSAQDMSAHSSMYNLTDLRTLPPSRLTSSIRSTALSRSSKCAFIPFLPRTPPIHRYMNLSSNKLHFAELLQFIIWVMPCFSRATLFLDAPVVFDVEETNI